MGTFKDFLLAVNETINNNELSALAGASSVADLEVNDDTIKETKEKLGSLLSVDAAKNNPTLAEHFKKQHYGTIKGELLGNVDTDLDNSAKELLGEESAKTLKDIEFTGDKIKKFVELSKVAIASKSGNKDEIEKLSADYNNKIKVLNSDIEKLGKQGEKSLLKEKQKYHGKLIEKEFDNVFNTYNLGKNYSEPFIKKSLKNEMFGKVSGIAKLTLSEDESTIIPKNPENDQMDLFIDNKPIKSVKEILDPLMGNFISKNNLIPDKKIDYKPADPVKISTLAQDLQQRRNQDSF